MGACASEDAALEKTVWPKHVPLFQRHRSAIRKSFFPSTRHRGATPSNYVQITFKYPQNPFQYPLQILQASSYSIHHPSHCDANRATCAAFLILHHRVRETVKSRTNSLCAKSSRQANGNVCGSSHRRWSGIMFRLRSSTYQPTAIHK